MNKFIGVKTIQHNEIHSLIKQTIIFRPRKYDYLMSIFRSTRLRMSIIFYKILYWWWINAHAIMYLVFLVILL